LACMPKVRAPAQSLVATVLNVVERFLPTVFMTLTGDREQRGDQSILDRGCGGLVIK